jgi:histone H3/H4
MQRKRKTSTIITKNINNTNTVPKNQKISNGTIQKIADNANIIKVVSNDSYAAINIIIEDNLLKIVGYAVVHMEHANRKTILIDDIKQAIELLNYRTKQRRMSIPNKLNVIPLHSFSRTVKEISKQKTKSKTTPRFADDAIHYLKSFIEIQIIKILKNTKKN